MVALTTDMIVIQIIRFLKVQGSKGACCGVVALTTSAMAGDGHCRVSPGPRRLKDCVVMVWLLLATGTGGS